MMMWCSGSIVGARGFDDDTGNAVYGGDGDDGDGGADGDDDADGDNPKLFKAGTWKTERVLSTAQVQIITTFTIVIIVVIIINIKTQINHLFRVSRLGSPEGQMQFWTSAPTTTSVFQTTLRSWRQVNILNILHFPEYFQYPKSPEHVEYSRFLEHHEFPGYLEYPEYSEVLNLEVIPRSSYTFFYQKQKALLLFVAMALECLP